MNSHSKERLLLSTGSMAAQVVHDLNLVKEFYSYSLENVEGAGDHILDRHVAMSDEKWGELARSLGKLHDTTAESGLQGLASTLERTCVSDIEMKTNMMYVVEAARAPMQYETLLFEMTVVHFIAVLESFIKNYISLVYTAHPSMLKSGREMKFEELANIRSRRHLLELMTARELRFVSNLSLRELSKYLKVKFSFNLSSEFSLFKPLDHIIQHRNHIVHQREPGLPDLPSSRAINRMVESRPGRKDFVNSSVIIIKSFVEYLHSTISKKLRLV